MKAQLLACGLALCVGIPAPAAAQARMPHRGASAIGGEVGAFFPKDDALTTGLVLEGFYEYYLTARESLRVGVGWMNPKWEAETSDSLRQVRIGADLLHNWEGGAVHPFVGAGLGAYFLQFRDNGESIGDSETKFGGSIFGGVEFFTSDTFAVKGEARYHIVPRTDQLDLNPSGLSLTFGVKSYF
jgi:Outer membrane protein beta-barrel domain